MSHAGKCIDNVDHCTNLYWYRLPETFSIRDEQIGVWWVTVAARYLYRARTIPGTLREKQPAPNLVQRGTTKQHQTISRRVLY